MRFIVTGFLVLFCIIAAVYVGYLRVKSEQPEPATYVVTAGIPVGGDFQLTSHKGETTKQSDFLGQVVLLYFGYTTCPDFCPTELAEINSALNLLGDQSSQVQPLFVTIDPHRDTQEVLRDFVADYSHGLIGLYGTEDEIKKVSDLYKVYATKTNDYGNDVYQMDHSTFVYIIGKDGKLISMLRYGTPAEVMAAEIKKALSMPRG